MGWRLLLSLQKLLPNPKVNIYFTENYFFFQFKDSDWYKSAEKLSFQILIKLITMFSLIKILIKVI